MNRKFKLDFNLLLLLGLVLQIFLLYLYIKYIGDYIENEIIDNAVVLIILITPIGVLYLIDKIPSKHFKSEKNAIETLWTVNKNGFSIETKILFFSKSKKYVTWDNVSLMVVRKQELYPLDLISIDILTIKESRIYTINEDNENWGMFIETIKDVFELNDIYDVLIDASITLSFKKAIYNRS